MTNNRDKIILMAALAALRSPSPVSSTGIGSYEVISGISGRVSPTSQWSLISGDSRKTIDTRATASTTGSSGKSGDEDYEVVLPPVSLGGSEIEQDKEYK